MRKLCKNPLDRHEVVPREQLFQDPGDWPPDGENQQDCGKENEENHEQIYLCEEFEWVDHDGSSLVMVTAAERNPVNRLIAVQHIGHLHRRSFCGSMATKMCERAEFLLNQCQVRLA